MCVIGVEASIYQHKTTLKSDMGDKEMLVIQIMTSKYYMKTFSVE